MRRLVPVSLLVVCSLAPARARADGDASSLGAPTRDPAASGDEAIAEALDPPADTDAIAIPTPPADTSSPSVELSVGVAPSLAIGGLGSLNPMLGIAPSIDVALALDRRVFFVLGGSVVASDASGDTALLASVPLRVQIYLDDPRVGAVVPTLRVGVSGLLAIWGATAFLGLDLAVAGGITWIASRWIALRMEIGGHAGGVAGEGAGTLQAGLDARGSLVLRL